MLANLGSQPILTQTEKPQCPWYMSAKQHSPSAGSGQVAQVIEWEVGCSPNWLIMGGVAVVAALLLLGGSR